MSDQPKQMGRPRKRPELGARVNITFRLNAKVRDRLMLEADAEGRSLSELLERVVDQHFAAADIRAIVREEIAAALKAGQSSTLPNAIALSDAAAGEIARFSFVPQWRGDLPS